MLIGTMEVLQDEEIKKEIWRAGDSMFYKQGVTDPDYCVLKFTAIKGRHYCDLKMENFFIKDLEWKIHSIDSYISMYFSMILCCNTFFPINVIACFGQ